MARHAERRWVGALEHPDGFATWLSCAAVGWVD
jgi:hypothetical protein